MASFFHHSDSNAGGRFLSTHSGLMQFNQVQGFPTVHIPSRAVQPGFLCGKLEQGTTDPQTWWSSTKSVQLHHFWGSVVPCSRPDKTGFFSAFQACTQAVHPQHPWGPFS